MTLGAALDPETFTRLSVSWIPPPYAPDARVHAWGNTHDRGNTFRRFPVGLPPGQCFDRSSVERFDQQIKAPQRAPKLKRSILLNGRSTHGEWSLLDGRSACRRRERGLNQAYPLYEVYGCCSASRDGRWLRGPEGLGGVGYSKALSVGPAP